MTEPSIVIQFAPLRLTPADLWGDDEIPEEMNAQVVADYILNDLRQLLTFLPSQRRMPGEVIVHVANPSYGGPESLLPELMPDQHIRSTVQVP